MIRKFFLITSVILTFSCILSLTGCGGKTEKVNFDMDSEIKKIIDVELYPEDLLNKELQEELKKESTEEEITFIDRSLLGYEGAENQLPIENMFKLDDYFYESGKTDWLGELWTVDIYRNFATLELTDVRFLLSFDENDPEYSYRRIKDITSEFLKKYNNVLYESNIFEFQLKDTTSVPIEIVFGIEDAIIHYMIYSDTTDEGLIKPYIQIFFVSRDGIHDLSNFEVAQEIEGLEIDLRNHKIKFKTMRVSPTAGYVVYDPDKMNQNLSPEDALTMGGIFYKD